MQYLKTRKKRENNVENTHKPYLRKQHRNNRKFSFFCHCSGNSNERQFLKDFVGAVPGSSGERVCLKEII